MHALDPQGITLCEAIRGLVTAEHPSYVAVGLWAQAARTPATEPMMELPGSSGRYVRVMDALVEAVRLDPAFSRPYETMANRLLEVDDDGVETVRLADGRVLHVRDLLLETIRLAPNTASAYETLGRTMIGDESVQLPFTPRRRMRRQDMFIEAIRLDPANACPYVFLASSLHSTNAVILADQRVMTPVDLAREAIKLDPTFGDAYYCIASKMCAPDVELLGKRWSKRMLCLEAVRLDPSLYPPYFVLATMTPPHEGSFQALGDGQQLTRAQLFVLAALHNTDDGFVLANMSAADKAACTWSVGRHRAFGRKANRAMATLLLGLDRLRLLPRFDPALIEEMLGAWSLLDTFLLN